jgi:hypothetical protein
MIRKGGPARDNGRPLREQDEWDEHARFMDGPFDEGFLVMAGPLGNSAWVDCPFGQIVLASPKLDADDHIRFVDPAVPPLELRRRYDARSPSLESQTAAATSDPSAKLPIPGEPSGRMFIRMAME